MTQVGAPSWMSSAETTSRTAAVRTSPTSAVQPPAESFGCSTPQSHAVASAARCDQRSAA